MDVILAAGKVVRVCTLDARENGVVYRLRLVLRFSVQARFLTAFGTTCGAI